MTTQEIIDYYKGLLILQYRALGNALGHTDAWVKRFLQNQIVSQVRDGFNLDNAIGVQLDKMGLYRGIPRIIFGIVQGSFWSLVPYDDGNPDSYLGWVEYLDDDPIWLWIQYDDLNRIASTLTDTQMRKLIMLRAAFQSSDGSLGSLDNILFDFFGVYVNLVDNKNMTITYEHQTADPDPDTLFLIANIAAIFPASAGVSFTVSEV